MTKETLTKNPNALFNQLKQLVVLVGLFTCIHMIPYQVHAQKAISLELKNSSIEKAIAAIEQQTDYRFLYNKTIVDVSQKVSLTTKNQSLEIVLRELLNGKNIDFKIENQQIVLFRKGQNTQSAKLINLKGKIVDKLGPLIGASVFVKGTTNGTTTDLDGNYTLENVPSNAIITISYIGYKTQEIQAQSTLLKKVTLSEDSAVLDEVVVTALGIKRQEKALSYNVQQVKAEEVTNVKDANFMNSLSGKVAGVNINASSSGVGGATRVVMRGPKSINSSNQVLYVIDGVPMFNVNNGETNGKFSLQPGGEGISDINPEDIESISVLSGPAAAALYGSAAAQGIVMITTKKGKEGKLQVVISHNSTFSKPFVMPKFQSSYVNRPGEFASWGEKKTSQYGTYNPKDFFNTGTNIQNTVAVTTGTDKNQTYFSAGTTNAQGIMPNSIYDRYNFTFRNTTTFLDDKMTLDFGFNYILQKDKNLVAQGRYYNPLTALYMFPRGENFDAVRTYQLWDSSRNIYTQNWTWGNALNMQNPYWIANKMNRTNDRSRYMTNASLKYQVFDWLDITGRVRLDNTKTQFEDRRFASTYQLFTAGSPYGFYSTTESKEKSLYADVLANINKTFGDYTLGANIGLSMAQESYRALGIQGGLKSPSNVFTPYAIEYKPTQDNHPNYGQWKHRTNSLFASAEVGWKNMLFLTVTGRNDWDSSLANTNNLHFFYPSVGLSSVVSQMVELPDWISFLKVRGAWASVGSAIQRNITSHWRYNYSTKSQSYETVTYKMPENFYPERTDSWEAGIAAKFFDGSVNLDLTLYKSNTKNQTFLRPISSSSGGYSHEYVQTGNVQNKGLEFALGYRKTWGDFTWNSNFTYSMNRNKIIELLPDPKETISKGGFDGAGILLKKGGTMGDLYSYNELARDPEGNIALNDKNNVMKIDLKSKPHYMGSVLPKGNLGFRNDFTWKGFNLGFMFSARLGGVVISSTQAMLDQNGVTKRTADARNNGGIRINKGMVNTESYFQVVGGESAVWSEYIYDGTNLRLQEAFVGYSFPTKWFNKKMNLSISLTGRNLWMIYNKAPFDPELTASTGTYYQGFDYFMQPSLQNFGVNVKLKF